MPVATIRSPSPVGSEAPSKRPRLAVDPEANLVDEQMALPLEYIKSYDRELDYRNKLVLAPMVRTGTLPTRLLALHYGAGLVWSPEVVDKAIIGSERTVDPDTGIITYSKGQGPIFYTHPMEKPYLIFQIGTSDPELAVKAAQTVQQDVAGIDLNCGCPKPFSTHSGMGAALLSTPDILLNILRALLDAIPLPISCKIRLLPTQPSTLLIASRILRTGIRNLTVHCRTRDMRSSEPAIWDRLSDIVQLGKQRGVPIICNGDGDGWANWESIRNKTGADSVMLARAAERNPSVFSPTGQVDTTTEIFSRLLNIAQRIDNPWGNTKFLLNQFKPSPPPISSKSKAEKKVVIEAIARAKSVEEIAEKLQIQLGRGEEVMRDIEARIREKRDPDMFAERKQAEADGVTADPIVNDISLQHADGFEVGVGQAAIERSS
ncbi:hypothetical protein BCR39DRAFT_461747 [Naematelia encephala]|uniref:DUS-like FMN-binding domain-containing protein n=1 Tax=Naematelia encephala TaxID=71784 RepID=A0A1Y2BJ16_9TREE|nr:hypothetical protein BCR39DRAFT_461747 [Naematelia encephala]